jgi:hypothetical protein
MALLKGKIEGVFPLKGRAHGLFDFKENIFASHLHADFDLYFSGQSQRCLLVSNYR